MKSYQILRNEAEQKLKNNNKENVLDVINKSFLKLLKCMDRYINNAKIFNYD